jgi:heat shock protein HslJ
MINLISKPKFWLVIFLAAALLAACQPPATPTPGLVPTQPPTNSAPTPPAPAATPETGDYTGAAFEIEGARVQLVGGLAETQTAVTRYFGNDAVGDLDGDAQDDAVFLVTQQGGGSGTFFYLVAALRQGSGYTGTNAALLGDRIAPQSTRIENGLITVNYADRKPEDSFATPPGVGVTRSFKIQDGKLVETILPGQITGRPWKWVRTQMSDGALDSPLQADAFTITLGADGKVTGATDCNRFFGTYTLQDNQLSFGPLASTKMFCEGSQETSFLKTLGQVRSYLTVENQLVLELEMDSGQMIFE